MIYPDDFEARIGIDLIREKIKGYCYSQAAHRYVTEMCFTTNVTIVIQYLRQTQEFKDILDRGEVFPGNHFYDPTEWLSRIAVEGNWLEPGDFLKISYAIETTAACQKFLVQRQETFPELFRLVEKVRICKELIQEIQQRIDPESNVRDSASSELSAIRKRLRAAQQQIRKTADSVFRNALQEKWIPDGALPTIRDGRIVLPILAEHKRRFRGFILDESATGQTVFMEPAELLEANNEIRELEYAERREIIRILQELTAILRASLPDLRAGFNLLTIIDFIRAKARIAQEYHGELPEVKAGPGLRWKFARHPLLLMSFKGSREVVPLDLELRQDRRMVLLSGPNAGGKSVALKTLGLLQYMVQCGLLVPVDSKSTFGIFQELFLDIGDQQSIENDLSTYSSHLRNMNIFLRQAGPASLVLLDELGGGTDPNFGGAIAQTVLQSLIKQQVWGLATTHYYNLKLFAGQQPGIVNAAMRFDEKNLKPLFVLEVGQPGSSFALEIARKSGLPETILQSAEALVGRDLAGFENLVRKLDKDRHELATRLAKLEKREVDAHANQQRYQQLATEIEVKKKEILAKAKEEAARLLKDTNKEIEKTIRHIRENSAEKKETKKVRQGLEGLKEKIIVPQEPKQPKPKTLKVGDRVRIVGQDGSGVIKSIQGKQVQVQFGPLMSLTKIDKLELAADAPEREVEVRLRSMGIDMNVRRSSFSSTLDVRGKRAEEVTADLERFMDDALLLSQGEVRIVHGKGEGVLRKIIRDYLKKLKGVASIADEHADRGGDGVTLVVLK